MGSKVSRLQKYQTLSESDGEESQSGGNQSKTSSLRDESSASDTSDAEKRLEQLQDEYDLQDKRINEAFHSALREVQSMVETEMNKIKTKFTAELEVLREQQLELINDAIDRKQSDAEQLKLQSQVKTPVKAEVLPLGARVEVAVDDDNMFGTVKTCAVRFGVTLPSGYFSCSLPGNVCSHVSDTSDFICFICN